MIFDSLFTPKNYKDPFLEKLAIEIKKPGWKLVELKDASYAIEKNGVYLWTESTPSTVGYNYRLYISDSDKKENAQSHRCDQQYGWLITEIDRLPHIRRTEMYDEIKNEEQNNKDTILSKLQRT